jgi:hypothetical protein
MRAKYTLERAKVDAASKYLAWYSRGGGVRVSLNHFSLPTGLAVCPPGEMPTSVNAFL